MIPFTSRQHNRLPANDEGVTIIPAFAVNNKLIEKIIARRVVREIILTFLQQLQTGSDNSTPHENTTILLVALSVELIKENFSNLP